MDYLDEELSEAKRKLERQKHTTLESGIYAGELYVKKEQNYIQQAKNLNGLAKEMYFG